MPEAREYLISAAAILALAVAINPARSATKIGATSLASNAVKGIVGPRSRPLGVGDAIYQNEKISTGNTGRAQLLFLDETSLTIGPSSTVILDRHVYDPSGKQGKLVLNAVSGAFRFVSGSGDKKGYKVKTPAGTIGIRGTIVDIQIGRLTLVRGIQGLARFCGRGMPDNRGRYGLNRQKCVTLRAGSYLLAGHGYISDARITRYSPCGSSYCQIIGDRAHNMQWNLHNVRIPTFMTPPSGRPQPNQR